MDFKVDGNWIYKKDDDDNVIAEVTFPNVEDGVVKINHTYVSNELRGQGIAAELMEACYNQIKDQDKKAVLTCPYAVKWFDDNPNKNDIVKKK